jgi:hypothetical protein
MWRAVDRATRHPCAILKILLPIGVGHQKIEDVFRKKRRLGSGPGFEKMGVQ